MRAFALTAALLLLATACSQGDGEASGGESAVPERPIEAVLAEHTDRLMSLPGVVGTAQGECGGQPCIKVLAVEDTPQLRSDVPTSLEGYAVEIVVTGAIEALDTPGPPQ